MKKPVVLLALLAALFTVSNCASGTKVSRVDPNTVTDLSGYWNDTDVRLVCDDLISACLSSVQVSRFILDYSVRNNGNTPACLVGNFKNESSEHIDTGIITSQMRSAIIKSGRLSFVSGGDVRNEVRGEQRDQLTYASDETAVSLGNETGARLLLTGSVKAMVERSGNTSVRSYFVTAEMTNIETNVILWSETNSKIKKVIRQSKYKF
jgi:hypothetical protein